MKKVTCCNLDGMLNFKNIYLLDNYLDENENVEIVLTDRVPYICPDEGVMYTSAKEASKYLNRGGRNFKITTVESGYEK